MYSCAKDRAQFRETSIRLPFGGIASSSETNVLRPAFVTQIKYSRSRTKDRSLLGIRTIPAFVRTALLAVTIFSSFLFAQITPLATMAVFGLLLMFAISNLGLYLAGFIGGFLNQQRRRRDNTVTQPKVTGSHSTLAIVMPIYHEDTEQVFNGLRTTWCSIERLGLTRRCDLFVLCDSTDPAIISEEERICRRLADELNLEFSAESNPSNVDTPGHRLFLVRRKERRNYKAGNIAHFLEHYGDWYDYMLVLDADSIMLGDRIKRMLDRMDANPELGILQSTIIPINSTTLFSRAFEYSIARCLPIFAYGMSWLFGRQCVYWGHNAMIRIKPFMEHAHLPIMPGKPPLGGPILSHDIVEAALLGRAGYSVEWDVEATGSYDSIPEDILRYGRRDRRWCQGNFQHFWLIFGDGMKPWHRFYFANGILSYLTGPLILFLALLGFAQAANNAGAGNVVVFDLQFLAGMFLLIGLPKVLGLVRFWLLCRKSPRRGAVCRQGGELLKELSSTVFEMAMGMLISPLLFYLHLRFVVEILFGESVAWKAQSRGVTKAISWRESAAVFWPPSVMGIAWLVSATAVCPDYLPALALILLGWILSVPLAVFSSSPWLGTVASQIGLFGNCLSAEENRELDLGSTELASLPIIPDRADVAVAQ